MIKQYLPTFKRGPKAGEPNPDQIDSLKANGTAQKLYSPQHPNLYLTISKNGVKKWAMAARINGQQKRLPLAEYGTDVGEVLAKWRDWTQAVKEGRNPLTDVQQAAQQTVPTLDDMIAEFLRVRTKLKPASKEVYLKTIRLWGPDMLERPINTFTPSEMVQRYQAICEAKSVGSANTWVSGIRSILNYAVDMEYLDRNPCDALKRQKIYEPTPARDVVLDADTLPKVLAYWWSKSGFGPRADGLEHVLNVRNGGDWVWPAFMEMALLTAARRGELAGMRWSEIDMGAKVWTLPAERAKNGKARSIPLTRRVLEILRMAQRVTAAVDKRVPRQADNDLVFFTSWMNLRPEKAQIGGFAWAVKQAGKATGVRFAMHDLRRTWITMASLNLNISPAVVEKIAGHAEGVTARHYIRPSIEDLRTTLQAVEDQILAVGQADEWKADGVGEGWAEVLLVDAGAVSNGVSYVGRGRTDNRAGVRHTVAPGTGNVTNDDLSDGVRLPELVQPRFS